MTGRRWAPARRGAILLAAPHPRALLRRVNPLALIAPLFLLFELWQLVIGERYLGIRQIRARADPRELPMSDWVAATWATGLVVYHLWMLTLLLHPVGRAQGFILIGVSLMGYSLRSVCGLNWVLVILTFEGSIRIGMLLSLAVATWRRLVA